jgi:hypothetical protein
MFNVQSVDAVIDLKNVQLLFSNLLCRMWNNMVVQKFVFSF